MAMGIEPSFCTNSKRRKGFRPKLPSIFARVASMSAVLT